MEKGFLSNFSLMNSAGVKYLDSTELLRNSSVDIFCHGNLSRRLLILKDERPEKGLEVFSDIPWIVNRKSSFVILEKGKTLMVQESQAQSGGRGRFFFLRE